MCHAMRLVHFKQQPFVQAMLSTPAPALGLAATLLAAALAQPGLVDPQRGEEVALAVVEVATAWMEMDDDLTTK